MSLASIPSRRGSSPSHFLPKRSSSFFMDGYLYQILPLILLNDAAQLRELPRLNSAISLAQRSRKQRQPASAGEQIPNGVAHSARAGLKMLGGVLHLLIAQPQNHREVPARCARRLAQFPVDQRPAEIFSEQPDRQSCTAAP